jgi:hypothetical protein
MNTTIAETNTIYLKRGDLSEPTINNIKVKLSWTLSEFQSYLIRNKNYMPDCQSLRFNGYALEEKKSLSSSGIKQGSEVEIIQKFCWPEIRMSIISERQEEMKENTKIDTSKVNLMTQRVTITMRVNSSYYHFSNVPLYRSIQTLLDANPKIKSYIPLRCRFILNKVEIDCSSVFYSLVDDNKKCIVTSTHLCIELRLH